MQELFSIKQTYAYILFKQMLKYIIPKCWGNFSSFGFYSVGFVCGEKPNVLKYAAGFQLVGNVFVYGLLRVSSN